MTSKRTDAGAKQAPSEETPVKQPKVDWQKHFNANDVPRLQQFITDCVALKRDEKKVGLELDALINKGVLKKDSIGMAAVLMAAGISKTTAFRWQSAAKLYERNDRLQYLGSTVASKLERQEGMTKAQTESIIANIVQALDTKPLTDKEVTAKIECAKAELKKERMTNKANKEKAANEEADNIKAERERAEEVAGDAAEAFNGLLGDLHFALKQAGNTYPLQQKREDLLERIKAVMTDDKLGIAVKEFAHRLITLLARPLPDFDLPKSKRKEPGTLADAADEVERGEITAEEAAEVVTG
jgi:hypothetical protein